jgi:Tfp pilus assembly protein PilF
LKQFIHSILIVPVTAAAVLAMMLSGCTQNRTAAKPVSQPNEYSAYLFSLATCLFYDYQYDRAEEIYRLAQKFDPQDPAFQRGIFNSIYYRLQQEQIPLSYFEGYTDTLLAEGVMDKLMLEEAYNAYIKNNELRKAKQILDIYLEDYSSARAYTSLFYLEQQMHDRLRPELLDKAFKLAGEDSTFLNSLGTLYLAFDSTKAEQVWRESMRYDTSDQAAALLWDLYARRREDAKLRNLYVSLQQRSDASRLDAVLGQTLMRGEANSLLTVADFILSSQDRQLILKLLQAAWEAQDDPTFERSLSALLNLTLQPAEEQLVAFYGALYYLKRDFPSIALSYIAKLNGKNALDDLVYVYRATLLANDKLDDAESLRFLKLQFKTMLEPAKEKEFSWEVKDYLLALTRLLTLDNRPEVEDDITKQCVLFFYENGRATFDTYIWLAQYYQKAKNDINMNAVLRNALQEYPDNADLLNWLGYSYVQKGINLTEAEALIRRALQINPDNPFYLDSLAWLYFEQKNYATALKYMEIPSRLQNIPSEIAYHIARIYIALDRYSEAVPYLKAGAAADDDPHFVKECRTLLEQFTP